jgi:hypothetical protein
MQGLIHYVRVRLRVFINNLLEHDGFKLVICESCGNPLFTGKYNDEHGNFHESCFIEWNHKRVLSGEVDVL